ncbi:hypothetical protein FEM03_16300 [Phragmitibacter flavus]|uniref:Methane oxygenase PmoA n=1 Tax=Phragmitibacter flavus TaxID=2576071 RepID=A0A5R8KB36_9BACT|nr:PmoA family protein [Phragmitibacter flavus]TLD69523.1 hypothetical protein FEM03_16300 [Phragmitibacter flavus]
MSFRTVFLLGALVGPLSLLAADPDAPRKITVSAGDVDRVESPVRFEVPGLSAGIYGLKSEGVQTVLQVDASGWGVMVEPKLAKGESKVYEIAPASMEEATEQVIAKVEGDVLAFVGAGGPLLSYQMGASKVPEGTSEIFSHGAYLHPVFSPGGKVVTADYPADHQHHRGIWMAWTKTSFEGRSPDFWNMGKDKSGKLTGEVRFDALHESWGGPVYGGFGSSHRHLDHTSGTEKEVLGELWNVRVYRPIMKPVALTLFDFNSVQTTAGAEPLKLPKYHYGGLGVRGNRAWDAEDAVVMLTSNGDDRKKGDATNAKWVYLGGDVEGAKTGMVVLIHPDNFRFPQPLRLNPKHPQLSVAPSQGGDWAIASDTTYVSNYRFVVMDGAPDADLLERLWLDYAKPIMVKVGKGK